LVVIDMGVVAFELGHRVLLLVMAYGIAIFNSAVLRVSNRSIG